MGKTLCVGKDGNNILYQYGIKYNFTGALFLIYRELQKYF